MANSATSLAHDVMRHKHIIVIFISAFLSWPLMAEEEMFIDRGACPGERCIYCALYVADADIVVYKSPSYGSEKIGKIKSGDAFITKTGEVHTPVCQPDPIHTLFGIT